MCFPVPLKHDHVSSLPRSLGCLVKGHCLCIWKAAAAVPRKSEFGSGRAGGNPRSRPGLDFELPFDLQEDRGQGKDREEGRILPVNGRFPQFSKVYLKKGRGKKASVGLALSSCSRLPTARSPRHFNSLSATCSGLSAVAGLALLERDGCCSCGSQPSRLTPWGGSPARRGAGLRPQAAGRSCSAGRPQRGLGLAPSGRTEHGVCRSPAGGRAVAEAWPPP